VPHHGPPTHGHGGSDAKAESEADLESKEGDYYFGEDGHSDVDWDAQSGQLLIDDKLLAELRHEQEVLKKATARQAKKVRKSRKGANSEELKAQASALAKQMRADEAKLSKVGDKVKEAEAKLSTDKKKLDKWVEQEFGSMKDLHKELAKAKAKIAQDVGAKGKDPDDAWIDREIAKKLAEADLVSMSTKKVKKGRKSAFVEEAHMLAARLQADQDHVQMLEAKIKGVEKDKASKPPATVKGWLANEFGKLKTLRTAHPEKQSGKHDHPYKFYSEKADEENNLEQVKKEEKEEEKRIKIEKKEKKTEHGRAKKLVKMEQHADEKKLANLEKLEHKLERAEESEKEETERGNKSGKGGTAHSKHEKKKEERVPVAELKRRERREKAKLRKEKLKEKVVHGEAKKELMQHEVADRKKLANLRKEVSSAKPTEKNDLVRFSDIAVKERSEKKKLIEEKNEEKEIAHELSSMRSKLATETAKEHNVEEGNWMEKEFGHMSEVKKLPKKGARQVLPSKTRAPGKKGNKAQQQAVLRAKETKERKKLKKEKMEEKFTHGKARQSLKKREAWDKKELAKLKHEEQKLKGAKTEHSPNKKANKKRRRKMKLQAVAFVVAGAVGALLVGILGTCLLLLPHTVPQPDFLFCN
jgi:hypothetical protein